MPFQIKDETSGNNILYIDNAGELGVGSLPAGGQALTVQGTGFISTSGTFGTGVFQPGSQAGYEGTVAVPGSGSSSVSISTLQNPTVTSGLPTSTVSTTVIIFSNGSSTTVTTNYSIW